MKEFIGTGSDTNLMSRYGQILFQKKWKSLIVFLIGSFFVTTTLCNAVQTGPEELFKESYDPEYEQAMAEKMKEGIDNFLFDYTGKVVGERDKFWNRRYDSPEIYTESVAPNRQRLRELTGVVDPRIPVRLVSTGDPDEGGIVAETSRCTVYQVTWTVLDGLKAEGLLLVPKGEVKASAVVIPDADELPEEYSGLRSGPDLALRLAEGGTEVIVPALVSRDSRYSGSDDLIPGNPWLRGAEPESVWTNLTHREWIHRQGYIMGRHIIGLEIQKILAAVDWLANRRVAADSRRIGVVGYGEGGLLALYSAAIDPRIDVGWVSGYFGPREELWREPVYRDIWGLLKEFGDAEIASLIVPASLIIEASPVPSVLEPLQPREVQRDFALPGRLETPAYEEVEREVQKLIGFFPDSMEVKPDLVLVSVDRHGSDEALYPFADRLGVQVEQVNPRRNLCDRRVSFDPEKRQQRVFLGMQEYIQDMIPISERTRYSFLQGDFSSPESWNQDMEPYRQQFYEELIGKIPEPLLPMNPRIRQIYDEPGWKGYEVVLDVWPGVFSWGILAVPKDLKPNETRPAVVMQHGIRGLPSTPIHVQSYHGVLPALANRGFVVFSPHNPYQFNIRRANAVKTSAFSVIIPQHRQILNFLDSLDYVDGSRIALYGKSWGGRTAQKVPIVLKDYAVVISSAYFNDWVRKTVSTNFRNSYFFENSIGIYKWNMGNTFTHAEMAALIAPRPFMVESGYRDGVAAHEMVAYEFAKVRRLYYAMGIDDRIELEFFMGGHDINGVGTFRFLHEHLDWPAPESPTEAQEILH